MGIGIHSLIDALPAPLNLNDGFWGVYQRGTRDSDLSHGALRAKLRCSAMPSARLSREAWRILNFRMFGNIRTSTQSLAIRSAYAQ